VSTLFEDPASRDRQAVLRDRILDRAGELYLQFGFRRTTMDDVARALGMSKRTLYQHVSSKDALVQAFVDRLTQRTFGRAHALIDEGGSLIQIMRRLVPFLRHRLALVSPAMMADLQRTYPQLWQQIHQGRSTVLDRLASRIAEAQEEGLVRPEIEPSVMVQIIQTVMQEVANPLVILELQLPIERVLQTFLTLLMHGALTERAVAEAVESS
jgi:AcrR family transcriptional regulator